MGCYGNHAFRHSLNGFWGYKILGHDNAWHGVSMSNSTPMETCPGVAR